MSWPAWEPPWTRPKPKGWPVPGPRPGPVETAQLLLGGLVAAFIFAQFISVGGFFFAIWILSREGIDAGKSITVITFTSFLDGIFIVIMAPLVYFTVGREELFTFTGMDTSGSWAGIGLFSLPD